MERSHRGRVRTLGKRVVLNGARGFESPPLLFGNRENVPFELKGTFLGIVIKRICNLLVPRALNTCYPTSTEGASNVKATSMGIDVKDLSCKV